MATHDIDSTEAAEIMRIATEYCRSATKNEAEAQKLLHSLAGIVKDQGAKLVHLGNVLFLVLVRSKGTVEFHTMGAEKSPRDFARDVQQLAKYLKNIGVKVMYTYTEDDQFKTVAKLTKLDVQQYKSKVQGKPVTVFVTEL